MAENYHLPLWIKANEIHSATSCFLDKESWNGQFNCIWRIMLNSLNHYFELQQVMQWNLLSYAPKNCRVREKPTDGQRRKKLLFVPLALHLDGLSDLHTVARVRRSKDPHGKCWSYKLKVPKGRFKMTAQAFLPIHEHVFPPFSYLCTA